MPDPLKIRLWRLKMALHLSDGRDVLIHYWDQASVLVQVGLLAPAGLPVARAATARKVLDKTLPSNELMAHWADSEGKMI